LLLTLKTGHKEKVPKRQPAPKPRFEKEAKKDFLNAWLALLYIIKVGI